MNILDLKRSAHGYVFRMPSDGGTSGGGDGGSSGSNGGNGYGGSGNGFGGGYGSGTGAGGGSTSLGSGLSIGSSGLGFGAGLSYSGPGTTSLSSGLSDGYGRNVTGSTGIRGDGGSGIGSGIGDSLTGLSGMDLGLSTAQQVGISDYLSKAETKELNFWSGLLDIAVSIGIPVVGVINAIAKKATGESIGSALAGLTKDYNLSKDVVGKIDAIATSTIGPGLSSNGNSGSRGNGQVGAGTSGSSSAALGGAAVSAADTATPSVVDALAGTLSLSTPGSGWGDYVKNTLPSLQSQAGQATARGDAAYDTGQTQSGTSMGLANQMNRDYTNIYRPFGQQMANEVNNLNSGAYLSQQRGKAMADVQSQSDAQMQAQQRNLSRMGVNPSSGRALAMGNQNAIATAAAKVGAAGQSDAFNKQNYLQGLSSMNNFGSTLQTQARANNSQAMDWSKYGLASGVTGLGANMDVSKLTTANAVGYGGLANQNTQTANDTLRAQTGQQSAINQQNQYNDSNDLGNLAASALVGGAVKGLGNYVFGGTSSQTPASEPWYMQSQG